ncbi:MAG: tetratricopeptide repeat protein [Bryobacteraceae bacterium]
MGAAPAASAQTAEETNQKAAATLTAGKLDTAVAELQASARRFPDDTHIQFNLGLALVRKGRLKEAVAPLQKAAKDPTLASEAHFLLGADYFETADYTKAARELTGLENSSHSERVLYMIEESNRRTQHIEEAKAAFHQLITRYPDSAWTHYLLGTAYEDQQQLDKAIAEYKLALERDSTIPNANFAIGYIYWQQQDTENARDWLQKEALKGCHALANYYLGEIARTEGNLHNAEARYKRAIECDPSNGDAHMRLGIAMGDQKRYRDAVLQLKQAIRLQPNESSAHYHLASIYTQMGRTAEAKAEYQKVRQIQAAKRKEGIAKQGSKP